jgi:hypothetical protein
MEIPYVNKNISCVRVRVLNIFLNFHYNSRLTIISGISLSVINKSVFRINNQLISVVDPNPHGSASFWYPGSASRSASNKNPDPYQIKIRIRIRIKVISSIRKQIRIRITLQMTSQNVWNVSLFEHFFKDLSLYLEARIWIQIRIRTRIKKKLESGSTSDSESGG